MAYTTIDDPSAFFQTVLYTGNGSDGYSITNDGNSDLQPDWLWFKNRNDTQVHQLFDTNRGIANALRSNATTVENTDDPNDRLTAINSDGFTLGDDGNPNTNSNTYVCWQWKANGGTTASNSDGDITSTVQANTTAGFSIVTYTGNGNDGDTVGHGLSGNWDLCILKNRGQTDYWTFSRTGTNQVLLLHDSVQEANHSTAYMSKASGVIGLVNAGDLGMVNNSSENYVAYVFKEVQGYSKFGEYTGNGNADGPFVHTGFKPAFVLKKGTGSGDWHITDNKQNSSNPHDDALRPNVNNATETGNTVDFLSNGFKIRTTGGSWNSNGQTYIYMAFAERPFVTSKGVPTTAR